MKGNACVRFCEHCAKEVNNLSEFTRKEALRLVRKSEGRICVRYIKDQATNGPVFADRPYQISRRAPRLAAGVMSASLSLSAAGYAQGGADIVDPKISIARISRLTYFDPLEKEKDVEIKTVDYTTPSISGTITDSNGAVIPNASLTLTNDQTKEGATTVSNEEGFYTFRNIAAGVYELIVESTGFQKYLLTNINITVDQGLEQDIMMNAGDVEVTVGGIGFVEYANALHQAVANDNLAEVRNLVVQGENVNGKDENYEKSTPLFVAVENGNVEIARTLLDFGAKVNARDNERRAPLMMLDEDASPELVNLLIRHGAKIHLVARDGNTALILAALNAKPEVLKALIDAGAYVNAQNKEGQTALMNAVVMGEIENVRALILAGANVNLKNKEGETAWDLASDSVIEELLEKTGADSE